MKRLIIVSTAALCFALPAQAAAAPPAADLSFSAVPDVINQNCDITASYVASGFNKASSAELFVVNQNGAIVVGPFTQLVTNGSVTIDPPFVFFRAYGTYTAVGHMFDKKGRVIANSEVTAGPTNCST